MSELVLGPICEYIVKQVGPGMGQQFEILYTEPHSDTGEEEARDTPTVGWGLCALLVHPHSWDPVLERGEPL